MKTEASRILATVLGLVLCSAAQDMAPAAFGAKPQILLVFGCCAGIPAAAIAGLFADALGSLPFGCCAAFFPLAAWLVRILPRPAGWAATAVAAGLCQKWMSAWCDMAAGTAAMCSAAVSAAVLSPAMDAALRLARRRIGIDGRPAR